MSTTYTLRPATEADQPVIKALIREVGINPLGIKWSRFIVAVDENKMLIGCAQVKPHGDAFLELASIAVRKEQRRQGIARSLIHALQAKHGRPLWLACMSPLVPFYEQFGFIEIADRQQMPIYFRRATRLFKLFLKITRSKGQPAVMVWAE